MKICYITSIYGNYDKLLAQPKQEIDSDFIAFVDNPDSIEKEDNTWKIIKADYESKDTRIGAKYYKFNTFLPYYDVHVWLDGSVRIKNSYFSNYVVSRTQEKDLAVIKHPERDCLFDEFEFCKDMPKYKKVAGLMEKQIKRYEDYEMPKHFGLWAMGVFFYKNTPIVRSLFSQIWNQNLIYSYQDQLSTAFIFWSNLYNPFTMTELNIFDNEWFSANTPHASEE